MSHITSDRPRAIFVHIPKTAGTSVYRALRHKMNTGIIRDHTTAADWKTSMPGEWERKFTFTFVRNPWDRFISLYYWWNIFQLSGAKTPRDHPAAFQRWVKGGCQVTGRGPLYQRDWFLDENEEQLVTYIGRFETLAFDYATICDRLSLPAHGTLERLMSSNRPRRPYQEFYDGETKEIIAANEKYIIDRFGYRFE